MFPAGWAWKWRRWTGSVTDKSWFNSLNSWKRIEVVNLQQCTVRGHWIMSFRRGSEARCFIGQIPRAMVPPQFYSHRHDLWLAPRNHGDEVVEFRGISWGGSVHLWTNHMSESWVRDLGGCALCRQRGYGTLWHCLVGPGIIRNAWYFTSLQYSVSPLRCGANPVRLTLQHDMY